MAAYFIVPAPGSYGGRTRVISSHHTLKAAERALGSQKGHAVQYCVRRGWLVKGDPFYQADLARFPVVYPYSPSNVDTPVPF